MASLGILKLPETNTVVDTDLFLVQQDGVTNQVSFNNLLFGLDNATFAPTVSAHSTQIEYLSTNLYAFSAQENSNFAYLSTFAVQQINLGMANLAYKMYPVGSIKCTSDSTNPGTYLTNTIWKLVSQGSFLAGTGTTTLNGNQYVNGDQNRTSYTFTAGANSTFATAPVQGLYYTTFASSPSAGGVVSYLPGWQPTNNGGFSYQQPVIITATNNPGFGLSGWSVQNPNFTSFNDVDVSVPNQISFYMPPNDVLVTAKYALTGTPNPNAYYNSLRSVPPAGGNIYYDYPTTLNGGFTAGSSVVIYARPYTGYVLAGFNVYFPQNPGYPVDYTKVNSNGEVSFYQPMTGAIVYANWTFAPGNSIGEYDVSLDGTQIPSHTHNFQIQMQNTQSTSSYQNGPQGAPAMRMDLTTTYTTLSNVTTDVAHNNVMPLYGTYVWLRIA